MCQICTTFGLDDGSAAQEAPAAGFRTATKNEDGTYSLRLTEKQMTNLITRLALSVVAERMPGL